MSIKPIFFNTDMVRAILDGRKTVTRRLVKPQPQYDVQCPLGYCTDGYKSEIGKFAFGSHENGGKMIFCKPPYYPGDILYVRETWHKYTKRIGKGDGCRLQEFYGYKASILNSEDAEESWKPAIHMPKEAARIWLKVKDVRVERLQEITEEQAKAEGANWKNGKNVGWEEKIRRSAVERFAEIWNSTIKKSNLDRYGWDANLWVWVIEFERCEKPEDFYANHGQADGYI